MSSKVKWLDTQIEGQVSVHTVPSCLSLCDLKSDNYYKLIVADIPLDLKTKCKLKVFKGTSQVAEQGLPGIPSSIQTLYIDELEPRVPGLVLRITPNEFMVK